MIDFDYRPIISGGKRCGVQWAPWMGDWFVSWSPRNSNEHAEGQWDHWVDLAIKILQDPLTEIVRPEARMAVGNLVPRDFYSEADRTLTDEEINERFDLPVESKSKS